MTQSPAPRLRPVTFRPRFTLLILYLGGFFLLFCFLLVLPDLIAGARSLPPGPDALTPEERALAERIARDALRGKVPIAAVAALVVTGIGAYAGWLPGLGEPPGRSPR